MLVDHRATLTVDTAAALAELNVAANHGKFGAPSMLELRSDAEAAVTAGAVEAGAYLISKPGGTKQAAFAVNLGPDETDAGRVDGERVRAFFAPDSAVIVRDESALRNTTMAEAGDVALDGYAFLLLLAVLLAESLLANRFYRRADST